MYIKNLITCFCLIFLLTHCKENPFMKTEKYPYAVTATGPEGYPMEVHMGYFLDEKEELICGVPRTGSLSAGWQGDAAEGGQNGDKIPAYLSLTYISYAEKKFYNVEAKLPAEKILEEFRKGYKLKKYMSDETEDLTYGKLTVGMAPGGVVVLWLSGKSHRVEICRLQAKEVFVDKDDFRRRVFENETQQEFFDVAYDLALSDSIKQDIKERGIPFGLWDEYREKYNYRFTFRPYDDRDKFTYINALYYNGEAEEILKPDLALKKYTSRGIPYRCNFIFFSYSTEIIFNDREMIQVFKEMKKKHPGKPIDIILTPTFLYNEIKVSVKCEDEEIPLSKYIMEGVWGESIDDAIERRALEENNGNGE